MTNAQKGDIEEGYTFAGANAYRVEEIIPVKELFRQLELEYNIALKENIANQMISKRIAV